MPEHLIEDYDSDVSSISSEDTQEVIDPEQSISSQVHIKLTTPTKTEHNLLSVTLQSQSAPTSPTLKKRPIPTVVLTNSSEESATESPTLKHQRSHSVDMLADAEFEDEKQTNSDQPAQNSKGRAFSRFTSGIANRFKTKNKFFGDTVTSSLPQESDTNPKPSAISSFKRTAVKTVTSTVTSLKEKTQKKIKTKSKTTMISI